MLRSIFRAIFSAAGRVIYAILSALIKFINLFIPWHKLPTWIAVFNLFVFRNDLRKYNLHDTSQIDLKPSEDEGPTWDPDDRWARTPNGIYNDLSDPKMGSAGTRFGRNMPFDHVWPDPPPKLYTPSPREVSRELMTRDHFKPAGTLNVLAAAWIQFQNHEWFNHKLNRKEFHEIELKDDDNWPHKPMKIERTLEDSTRAGEDKNKPPTFLSEETHWWDGSQIYGSSQKLEDKLRSHEDGKLKVESSNWAEFRLLPDDRDPNKSGFDLTGFNNNYWAGLGLLHTIFTLEHNAICDELRREYPTWGDDRLFKTARQINGALMAKIHTVEWTPAILGHPALQIAMSANWWGLIGERLTKMLGRVSDSEAISGIPGSSVDHHGAPYYLAEEFVSVYRLHPLIPDDYQLYSHENDAHVRDATFNDIQGNQTRPIMSEISQKDLFYSFGIANPGAVVLHNFPRALQNFKRPDGHDMDLAAVDVMRDRERGVPRYNEFRQLLRMPRVSSFRKLTKNKQWAAEIKKLYDGDIDKVDLMVGMYAEEPPKGFGFSDTAFRIFILMASRRLKSDRFFTDDFRPEVYTNVGMRWVNDNGMKTVLQRHYPELTPAFQNAPTAFSPWQRANQI